MKETYAWVPWFRELAGKIDEGGETYLAEAAKKVAWRDDAKKQPLLEHGDVNIDPFSFFYSLAQRSQDLRSRKRIYPSIVKEFNMEHQPPVESDEGFIFPTPSYRAQVLFHNKGQSRPTLLWNLFRGAVRGLDSVSPQDFDGALSSVCQKTPLLELSCHGPPHFPRQLQPNFVQEDASDRSGWGDGWWTGPDLRNAAIGRRSRLLGSGFKG